ncbi:MAG: bifunctional proline dehydrogenase/L-glutamate gamma-semialdehyde dehydrogenase PutA [Proteobacteria bacterium]|nr:MAG: bifunctional proline dehydrogenase/L-glutamate gamma-semialdehyde dehydrogenase PutA [Pseudomonadota bacterium]
MFVGIDSASEPALGAINRLYRVDESTCVVQLMSALQLTIEARQRVVKQAADWVRAIRQREVSASGLDAFLQEYDLSSREGVMLMCLAEALLRIPDAETANQLIRDKLGEADWEAHLGDSESLFVNASTWALMLTGRLVRLGQEETRDWGATLRRLISRSGEPVIRRAITQSMRILGRQFVMGRTIDEAIERARAWEKHGYRYSYDMLGEAALTRADAERYQNHYLQAIAAIGSAAKGAGPVAGPGVSVKLSALHPRYEVAQRERVRKELTHSLLSLAQAAKEGDINLCVDAEEAERLELSLEIIAAVARHPSLHGWDGFGLALQAYQKRAPAVIDWLAGLAGSTRHRLMVRLVKGAYWDTEIKKAQERGLEGYPVFTRKESTDLSYLVCAEKLLAAGPVFYPQFATHNAHTIAAVLEMAGGRRDLEFQRLHGMGEPLCDPLVAAGGKGAVECRIYAPVGGHEELLAYLVRRLLENGANTSFVNRIVQEELPVEEIVADPVARIEALQTLPHPRIPLPEEIYGSQRRNARGLELADRAVLETLSQAMAEGWRESRRAGPIVGGRTLEEGAECPVVDPADARRQVGSVFSATGDSVDEAVSRAYTIASEWDRRGAAVRAGILSRVADLMEMRCAELMAGCVREAGKTVPDALAEVREAVDFCRYYATQAQLHFEQPLALPGPTGETNQLTLHGRGVFACISPWNFPLAIFTGQVAAALAAGNAVIAKPAEQTPLIAAAAVHLFHQAGVPADVLHLLTGDGAEVGGRLVADRRIAGVAFTGSTETARLIQRSLVERGGPIVPLIAETGGQNAMLVDSSALLEQVVIDVVNSAFRSAGQRCSALRVLFVQNDVADRLLTMLAGAMDELVIGDPALLKTDVGPVIDAASRAMLERHAERMRTEGRVIHEMTLPPGCGHGHFVAPMAVEIDSIARLEREVFGPILHVVRYRASELDKVLNAINGTGYGLTLGIHTRIDARARYIHRRLRVGNTYVNRNMIGAVVGVQPFGGEGLSGTGPKAGGPHYLQRFATERTLTINTTAAGGNATLISLQEDA